MTSSYSTSSMTCSDDPLGPSLAEICSGSAFVAFATILNSLIRSRRVISGLCDRVEPIEEPDDVYDFVVVGSGAGGSPVASRLSEIANWKVLVLEAGPDEPAFGEVPMLMPIVQDPSFDWIYATTNESHACLSTNGSCSILTGKLLGGTTSNNGMSYFRGVPTDFNNWFASGNPGWSWDEVFPYFLNAEDNGEIERVGTTYHRTGGLLSVERFPYTHPFGYSILEAALQAGYEISEDLNGDNIIGYSRIQNMIRNGVRVSSAAAYLRPARNRPNLHVSLNSTASRVIIEDGRAVGVEYYKNGELKTVKATKEVIVSAGVFESPKLLMLSGIGPKEHLKSVGIEVVKDLPGVGENYHDHLQFCVDYTINENDTYEYDWDSAAEYIANQTGPLSGIGASSIMGRLATDQTTSDYPDIQTVFSGYLPFCVPGDIGALASTGKRSIGICTSIVHSKSRGRVTLASNDYLDSAVVWGNYLGESSDVDRLVKGMKLTTALADTEAMKAYNLTMSTTALEACSDYIFASTEYWACAVRQEAVPDLHPAGTCKMGPESDPMAVVDHRLRVHGIKGLRVSDAAVMPKVTSSSPAATTIMIGERAAAFIKEDFLE